MQTFKNWFRTVARSIDIVDVEDIIAKDAVNLLSELLAGSTVGLVGAVSLNLLLSLSRVQGMAVCEGEQVVHVRVCNWVSHTVTHGNTDQVDVGLATAVSSHDAVCQGRHVDACEGLTTIG